MSTDDVSKGEDVEDEQERTKFQTLGGDWGQRSDWGEGKAGEGEQLLILMKWCLLERYDLSQ